MIRQSPRLILKRIPNQRLKKRFKLPSIPSLNTPILPQVHTYTYNGRPGKRGPDAQGREGTCFAFSGDAQGISTISAWPGSLDILGTVIDLLKKRRANNVKYWMDGSE